MTQLEKAKSAVSTTRVRAISPQVAEVRQNINLLHEAMKSVMLKDVHFGVIPGCQKPSLYKPGAEVIIALFRLTTDPEVLDMSKDGEIRYQVKVHIKSKDGVFVGSGIGECSSGEEKYSWRAAVCQEEFDVTPETMRRIKFKKYQGNVSQVQQVRVSPSDMANTILKMAKKRGLIDAVLTATGASDIFSQDIEDLPEGYVSPEMATGTPTTNEQQKDGSDMVSQEQPKNDTENHPRTGNVGANPISEPQRKRLYAIAMGTGMSQDDFKAHLMNNFNYASSKDVDRSDYDKICSYFEGK